MIKMIKILQHWRYCQILAH